MPSLLSISNIQRRAGFMLMEVMLAVMIFSIAVIGLGRCVENCVAADRLNEENTRACLALENAMAAMEGGAVPLVESNTEELKGRFSGMKLRTVRTPLKEKNEKGQEIFGLFAITLSVEWMSGGQKQVKELQFYLSPRQR
jgi:type II secretory pathway component PulJ